MVKSCCVEGCKSEWSPVSDISLFSFPLNNEQLLEKWMKEIPTKCKITKNTRICNLHFDGNGLEERFGKRILKKFAVPSLFQFEKCTKHIPLLNNTVNDTRRNVLIVLTPIQERIEVQNPLHGNFNNKNENNNNESPLRNTGVSEINNAVNDTARIEINNALNDTARNVLTVLSPKQERMEVQGPLHLNSNNENKYSSRESPLIEISDVNNSVNDTALSVLNILTPVQERMEVQDSLNINSDDDNKYISIDPVRSIEIFKINNAVNDTAKNVFKVLTPIQEKMEVEDSLHVNSDEVNKYNSSESPISKIEVKIFNELNDTAKNVLGVLTPIQEKIEVEDTLHVNFDNENKYNSRKSSLSKIEIFDALGDTARNVLDVLTPIQERIEVEDPIHVNFDDQNKYNSNESSLSKIEIFNALNDTARNVMDVLTPIQERIKDPLHINFDDMNKYNSNENPLSKMKIFKINTALNDAARNVLGGLTPIHERIEVEDTLHVNFDDMNKYNSNENSLSKIENFNALYDTARNVLDALTPMQERILVENPLHVNFNNGNKCNETPQSKIEFFNELNDTARNVLDVLTPTQERIEVKDPLHDNSDDVNKYNREIPLSKKEIFNALNDNARNVLDALTPIQERIEVEDSLHANFDDLNKYNSSENPLSKIEIYKFNNALNNTARNVLNILTPIQERIEDPLHINFDDENIYSNNESPLKKIEISEINNLVNDTARNIFIVLPPIQERMNLQDSINVNFDTENKNSSESSPKKVETKSASTQVDPNHIPPSERETALRRKIKILQNRLRRRDDKINKISQLIKELKKSGNLTEELEDVLIRRFSGFNLELFINELKNSKTSKKEYTHKMKEFASTLYFYSPKGYKYVRSKLNLPHEATLRKWIGQCTCEVDFLSGALIFSENKCLKSDLKDVTL